MLARSLVRRRSAAAYNAFQQGSGARSRTFEGVRSKASRGFASRTKEKEMEAILKDEGSGVGASHALVLDKSGGCGAMYEVRVVAPAFEKKPMVQQHRKVTQALAAQIKDMHGLQIYTWAPTKFEGLSESKRTEIFAVPEE